MMSAEWVQSGCRVGAGRGVEGSRRRTASSLLSATPHLYGDLERTHPLLGLPRLAQLNVELVDTTHQLLLREPHDPRLVRVTLRLLELLQPTTGLGVEHVHLLVGRGRTVVEVAAERGGSDPVDVEQVRVDFDLTRHGILLQDVRTPLLPRQEARGRRLLGVLRCAQQHRADGREGGARRAPARAKWIARTERVQLGSCQQRQRVHHCLWQWRCTCWFRLRLLLELERVLSDRRGFLQHHLGRIRARARVPLRVAHRLQKFRGHLLRSWITPRHSIRRSAKPSVQKRSKKMK